MIIKGITLKNIGVHSSLKKEFNAGYNIIEGLSKTGKTTILNAIEAVFSSSNSSICRNIVNNKCPSGTIELIIENEGNEYKIKRTFGEGSEITVNQEVCKNPASLIEYLKLKDSDLNGMRLERFFNNMSSKERRDLYLSSKGLVFPELDGFEDSENPIADKENAIKFSKSKIDDLEERIKSQKDLLNTKLKNFKDENKFDKKKVEEEIKQNEDLLKEKEDEKKEITKRYEESSKSLNGAENKVKDLKKELSDLKRDLESLEKGKCHFCGSKIKDAEKEVNIKKQIQEKSDLIKKGESAIITRRAKKDEALKELNSSSDPIKNIASKIAELKESLKREDDGNIIKALKETLKKDEDKLDTLKKMIELDITTLNNYKDNIIPEFEKIINDSFVSVYFKKKEVKINIMDKISKKLCFDMLFYGRSFETLCGEETIFAKIDIAANIGSKCIIIDGLESGGDDNTFEKLCKKTGAQIIGTRRTSEIKIKQKEEKNEENGNIE